MNAGNFILLTVVCLALSIIAFYIKHIIDEAKYEEERKQKEKAREEYWKKIIEEGQQRVEEAKRIVEETDKLVREYEKRTGHGKLVLTPDQWRERDLEQVKQSIYKQEPEQGSTEPSMEAKLTMMQIQETRRLREELEEARREAKREADRRYWKELEERQRKEGAEMIEGALWGLVAGKMYNEYQDYKHKQLFGKDKK